MRFALLFPASIGLAALLLAGCGDGPDEPAAASTPAVEGTPGIPDDFGPAPLLGGNITAIFPEHGKTVAAALTKSLVDGDGKGVCAKVTFEGLPQYAQWFRMAVDGVEVTEELLWIVPTREAPTNGTMCYTPKDGLSAGKHTAAIAVQDPNNPLAESKQVVGWAFEVAP
jgi:hypothetical protein